MKCDVNIISRADLWLSASVDATGRREISMRQSKKIAESTRRRDSIHLEGPPGGL